jgi:hypothetical protein
MSVTAQICRKIIGPTSMIRNRSNGVTRRRCTVNNQSPGILDAVGYTAMLHGLAWSCSIQNRLRVPVYPCVEGYRSDEGTCWEAYSLSDSRAFALVMASSRSSA